MSAGWQPLSLRVCLIHHAGSDAGSSLRSRLYKHYRRDPHKNLGEGGLGLEVDYRSEPAMPSVTPIPVAFERSQVTAVVAILDRDFASDPDLSGYLTHVATEAKLLFPRAAVLAVAVDEEGRRLATAGKITDWQTLDATTWPPGEFIRRLFTSIDFLLCKLLNAYLEAKANPTANVTRLRSAYARKRRIFLSHSKHDHDRRGETIARNLKATLEAMSTEAFFDAVDIGSGDPWENMIDDAASSHALVVILTDSYSSRTWCRKEVLAAKRASVPIVVANCLEDYEERAFPYAGNVPVVQMAQDVLGRQLYLIGRLFDELLRDLVWKCNIADAPPTGTLFYGRVPELVTLAYLEQELESNGRARPMTVVYPGVPLGAEEQELFTTVAPHVRLIPFISWKAGIET